MLSLFRLTDGARVKDGHHRTINWVREVNEIICYYYVGGGEEGDRDAHSVRDIDRRERKRKKEHEKENERERERKNNR